MTELPIWAIEAGVPSSHIAAAAVRVARMIDSHGSEIADLRRSYQQHASGAFYPVPDMIKGEALLIDCGLATQIGTRLIPTPDLLAIAAQDEAAAASEITMRVLAELPPTTDPDQIADVLEAAGMEADRREEMLLALGAKYDDRLAREVGEIGEEIVMGALKDELDGLGHPELAAQVRRVSLGSDALGYDVTAPRIVGARRLFEVKASTTPYEIQFFLSRNEANIGERYPDDWFLIYVKVTDVDRRAGEIIGWSHRYSLAPHLPADHGAGTWSRVQIRLDDAALEPGLPA
jgi:hypothetical protein